MPLYEYQCDSCGRRFERIQKFSDPAVSECPTCGAPVRKLPSSPAIQFKGSGFYITDYAKSGKSSESDGSSKSSAEEKKPSDTGAKADKADAGTSPAKSDSGSDSKATETKETKKPDTPGKS